MISGFHCVASIIQRCSPTFIAHNDHIVVARRLSHIYKVVARRLSHMYKVVARRLNIAHKYKVVDRVVRNPLSSVNFTKKKESPLKLLFHTYVLSQLFLGYLV